MATLVGQKKGKQIEVSTDGQRLIYNASREYLVYDDTGTAGEGDILLTAGLPSVNLAYVFDGVPAQLVCKSKSAQQWENNNKYWTVTAEYDNEPQNTESDTGGNETDPGDPTTWYSIVKFDFETYERALNGLTAFNNRPYATPITLADIMPVVKFTQYMPPDITVYDLIEGFHNRTNSNDFLGAPPTYWLLTIEGAEFGVTNGYKCWKVDFKLSYRSFEYEAGEVYDVDKDYKSPDLVQTQYTSRLTYPGWYVYIPQIDTIDIDGTPFQDSFQNQGEAGKLDEDGKFKADQTDTVTYKQHPIYYAKDFSFIRIRNIQ